MTQLAGGLPIFLKLGGSLISDKRQVNRMGIIVFGQIVIKKITRRSRFAGQGQQIGVS